MSQLLAAPLRPDPTMDALRAQSLFEAGDHRGAIRAADAVLRADPDDLVARMTRAAALNALCRFSEAASDLAVVVAARPGRAGLLIGLGTAQAEAGNARDAIATLTAAIAADPASADAAAALGAVCARTGNTAAAITACRYALSLDPGQIAAHQNLAALLPPDDPATLRHRDAAYRLRPIITIPGPPAAPVILVLTCAAAANIPLDHLLPRRHATQIRWFIDYAAPNQIPPPHDCILNAIGDPDLMPPLAPSVRHLLDTTDRPVLNHPDRIGLTGRANLPALLAGIPDIVVPPVSRVARKAEGEDGQGEGGWRRGHRLPVIVRPAGSHGGTDLVLAETEPAADRAIGRAPYSYVTDFIDYRSPADRFYRKYRAIFVDRIAYPYHLAIAPHWLVLYWTAGMEHDAARRAAEAAFLTDPTGALGPRAMACLGEIAARLDLDYGGIDFSILPDGRLLVFEVNATMLVHPETDPLFAYKNPAVIAIQSAVERMLDRFKA